MGDRWTECRVLWWLQKEFDLKQYIYQEMLLILCEAAYDHVFESIKDLNQENFLQPLDRDFLACVIKSGADRVLSFVLKNFSEGTQPVEKIYTDVIRLCPEEKKQAMLKALKKYSQSK